MYSDPLFLYLIICCLSFQEKAVVQNICPLELLREALLVPNAKLNRDLWIVLLDGHLNEGKAMNRKLFLSDFQGHVIQM